MYLLTEPAWRYLLFMGFIFLYSLYRGIHPVYTAHQQKQQRIRKLAEKALQQRRQEGDLTDTRIKVTIPLPSFEKRLRLVLEVGVACLVCVFSLFWSLRLFQTARHTHLALTAAAVKDDYTATKEYYLALKSDPIAGKIHWSFTAMTSEEDRQNGELNEALLKTRLHPDDPEALSKLGGIYIHLKRYKEAVKACRAALLLRPKSGVLHSNLGSALSANLQLDEAIEEMQRAIRTDPNNGSYYVNLGDIYFYRHDWERAEEAYRTALSSNPALIPPYWRLSEIMTRQGKQEEAKAFLSRLLDQSHMPEDAATITQARASLAAMK